MRLALDQTERLRRNACVRRFRRRLAMVGCWCAAVVGLLLPAARGQAPTQSYPSDLYYAAYRLYYDGDYRDAGSAFRRAARGGVASSRGRWIDSICYYTMMGECHYRLGQLDEALDQYGAALRLALQHEGWTVRIRWPERIDVSQKTIPRPPTWGPSQRNRQLARIPRTMQMVQGSVDTATAAASGGLLQQRFFMTIDVQEVMRCTALALRRRRQILGPLAKHDSMHAELSNSLARMRMPANHWARIWKSALVGMALSAEGKPKEAVAALQQSLSISNTLDHSLTSMALLELGDIAFAQDRLPEAMTYYYEATFPAANLELFDDVAEGLLGAAKVHLVVGKGSMYPPLVPAAQWAHRDSRAVETAVLAMGAENALAIGNPKLAEQMIAQANRAMGRSDLRIGPLGGRLEYALAHARLKVGDAATSRKSFAKALTIQRATGVWLFRVAAADRLITRGRVSARVAADLYQQLLRVPNGKDWQSDPLDALAYLTTPLEKVLERWFDLSLKRKETEKALWISERIRQHRFLRTQPLGGRLLSLRWLLSGPAERLDQDALRQRAELYNRYPAYRPMEEKAQALKSRLRELAHEEENQQQLASLWKELAVISETQESLLWDIAMARVDIPLFVPQVATLEQIQAALGKDERAVVFFQTKRALYVMLVRAEDYSIQTLGAARTWRAATAKWLREMNLIDAHRTATFEQERIDAWKGFGRKIAEQLEKAFPGGLLGDAKQITIIPDGALWYLPFSAIPDADGKPLLARAQIRTLPLLSMIVTPGTPPRRDGTPVLIRGRFFSQEQEALETAAVEDLIQGLPSLLQVTQLPAPGHLIVPTWDRLVVLADSPPSKEGWGQWSPLAIDRGRPGSHLSDWMRLPWGAPRDIVLPGFHTAAETALKSRTNGQELFQLTCSLYASGTQTMLISRWRGAAFSSFDLVREFTTELDGLRPRAAWQRAAQLMWESEIDPAVEPRIDIGKDVERLSGEHPYFWSGFLLFDLNLPKPKEAEMEAKKIEKSPKKEEQ